MIPAADFDTRLTALERAMAADRTEIVAQLAELRVLIALGSAGILVDG